MSAIGSAMLANGVIDRRRLWEAPTWVGFIFVAFIVPQAIHIESSGIGDSLDAWLAWYYIAGCLVAFWWGFETTKRKALRSSTRESRPISDGPLVVKTTVMLALGAASLSKINEMSSAQGHGTSWTGVITLYYLIFQCIFMALSIAVTRWLATGRRAWMVIGSTAAALAFIAIAANAKRSLTAEVFFIAGASLFFLRSWTPPRSSVLALMVFGTVLVHQVGPIRDYVKSGNGNAFQAVLEGVPFEQFAYFAPGKAPELTQGLVDIYRYRQHGRWTGPAPLWNRIVHQYVPAFLLGQEVKASLKVALPNENYDRLDRFDWHGATRTGFSDSFRSYSVFGVLVFAFLGWLMSILYVKACAGSHWAIFLYPLLINDSMFAITESTSRFFSGGFFVALVGVLLFWRPTVGTSKYRFRLSQQHLGAPTAKPLDGWRP